MGAKIVHYGLREIEAAVIHGYKHAEGLKIGVVVSFDAFESVCKLYQAFTFAFPPSIRVAIESDVETASSGQDVPIATIVRPIMSGEIWSFLAIAHALSIKKSQNFTKKNTPTPKSTTKQAICAGAGNLSIKLNIFNLLFFLFNKKLYYISV